MQGVREPHVADERLRDWTPPVACVGRTWPMIYAGLDDKDRASLDVRWPHVADELRRAGR